MVMAREKIRLSRLGILLLLFVFFWTYGMVLAPPKAEAKTAVKSVNAGHHIVTLYDDHTVSAVANLYSTESPNGHGELGVDKEINVLDIAAHNCCSMALYGDGTVKTCGHATVFHGGYGNYSTNYGYCDYIYSSREKRYVPIHNQQGAGSIRNPNPNANIVAISMHETCYAVLYADGTVKAEMWNITSQTVTGHYPDAKAIRVMGSHVREYYGGYYWVNYLGVQILKEDGSIETIGNYNGTFTGEWGYRLENKRPTVQLTGTPTVNQANNTLTFKVKVVDPPDRPDSTIPTEIELNYGDAFVPVKNFKANNITITNGTLTANNGTDYTITVNNINTLVPAEVPGFTLRVIATDGFGTRGGKAVNIGAVGGGGSDASGVLAQWSLDSDKDKVVQDSSGNGNKGTIKEATLTTGIISNALRFDGENDYVSIARSSFNNLANWTFEAWVKPEGPGIIYSEGNPAVTLQISMGANDSISVGTWHQNRLGYWQWFSSGDNSLKKNTWNHLVISLSNGGPAANSGTVICYVNGNLVQSGSLGCEYNSGTKEAAMGGNIGVKSGQVLTPFCGCIDEVTLYNRVLTPQEVKQNYEKVVFLDNIKLTNGFNDEASAPCTFGTHINKIEFDLRKTVNKLVFELEMPSNMKLARLQKIYIYDSAEKKNKEITITNATVNNNVISIQQQLAAGHYTLELILSIDDRLVVKSKSYYDEKEIKTNLESNEFKFEFMEFKELPNVT